MEVMIGIDLCRVSSKEQAEGFSLESQAVGNKSYAGKNGINLAKRFQIAESASAGKNRKIFKQLMELLNKDNSITELIVEKTDRVTRNLSDLVQVNDWLQKSENNRLHLVKENLIITKNSKSTETFIWSIKASVAEFYSRNLKEEVLKGMDQKAEEGWYPNNRKFGYRLVLKDRRKVWEINPAEAYFVKQVFLLYSSGFSLKEVRNRVFELGLNRNGKPISANSLSIILKDPFYIGRFSWRGKIYEGNHPPLITPEAYYRAQEILAGKGHSRFTKHFFPYSKGLIKCPTCNHSLVGELQKGVVYYRCHKCKGQKYLKEETIGLEILKHLEKFEVDKPSLADWIRDALKAYRGEELFFTNSVVDSLSEQLKQVHTRRSKLFDDHADGKIDESFYQQKLTEYSSQIKDFEKGIAANNRNEELSIKLAHSIFELALRANKLYSKKFTPEEKWRFLKVASSNITNKGDYLDVTYKNGFEVLLNRPKLQVGEPHRIRTCNRMLKRHLLYR